MLGRRRRRRLCRRSCITAALDKPQDSTTCGLALISLLTAYRTLRSLHTVFDYVAKHQNFVVSYRINAVSYTHLTLPTKRIV